MLTGSRQFPIVRHPTFDVSQRPFLDSFRGIDGVFDRTMEAWEAAREIGLKVQINTTVARLNMADLPSIAPLPEEVAGMVHQRRA